MIGMMAFVFGLFVGAVIGLVVAALMNVSGRDE